MKISLRKASNIQSQIEQEINFISTVALVELDEFVNPEVFLHEKHSELCGKIAKKLSLIEAQFEIRELLGHANATSGVNAKLTELACINKASSVYESLINEMHLQKKVELLAAHQEKMKTSKPESYSYRLMTISSGVLTQNDLDEFTKKIAELRKHKTNLNDEILELNIKHEITLNQKIVDILTVANIL